MIKLNYSLRVFKKNIHLIKNATM